MSRWPPTCWPSPRPPIRCPPTCTTPAGPARMPGRSSIDRVGRVARMASYTATAPPPPLRSSISPCVPRSPPRSPASSDSPPPTRRRCRCSSPRSAPTPLYIRLPRFVSASSCRGSTPPKKHAHSRERGCCSNRDSDGRMPDQINLRYVLFLAATAATGGLLFGFDVAIISGAGPFLLRHFQLDDLSLGVAFSSLLFGCIVGSAVAGRVTDRYGRRRILLWVAALFAITCAATGLAWNFNVFLLARFLGGLAVGAVSLVSPMYVSEVSPPAVRGRMGTLYQMSIVTGILVSYCINYGLRGLGEDNWRWMFATGVIPSLIFFTLLLLAPETPRFLVIAGNRAAAFDIMQRIGGRASAELSMNENTASLITPRGAW